MERFNHIIALFMAMVAENQPDRISILAHGFDFSELDFSQKVQGQSWVIEEAESEMGNKFKLARLEIGRSDLTLFDK